MLGISGTEDRAEALRLAREIADIEVPAHYTKGGGFRALGLRMVVFEDELGAALSLMEFPGEPEKEPRLKSDLERQQIEERTYSIRGRDREVTIITGFDASGVRRVEIGTALVAKDGSTAMLVLNMSEARWKTVGAAEFESIVASTDPARSAALRQSARADGLESAQAPVARREHSTANAVPDPGRNPDTL
ncbi:MAG: hypothetical protein OEQ13_12775, partial [Acidobacteriota bacterium]|nr:hypothetical protein [Acidobacteriota bacterium]